MDENNRAILAAATVSAAAANRAMAQLTHMLLLKGVLAQEEVEALRHFHLLAFDESLEAIQNPQSRAAIDTMRDQADALWGHALRGPEAG